MMNVDDAVKLIEQNFISLGDEELSLNSASGRELAHNLTADRNYPPFHRVTMDGIAIKYSDYINGQRCFRIEGVQPAGMAALALNQINTCIEVMTGAVLPLDADLVIPYEHLKIENGYANIVVEGERASMQNVHLQGSDCRSGEILLNANNHLIGPHTAIAASIGNSSVVVKKHPKILIVTTGDELVEVEATPLEYQIRKSNALALKHSLQLRGQDLITVAHLPDELPAIRDFYQRHIPAYDVVIFTGGVSKGKFDFLPQVFQEMQVETIFHGVAQRPGKPMWFGLDQKHQTTIFGLPGNPISCLVCLHRYILPILNNKKQMYAQLTQDVSFKPDLTYFVPVQLEFNQQGGVLAHPNLAQNSGEFAALAATDGFIELPRGRDYFKTGESFKFFSWGRVCN
jgi:molybdopterin molybdotransferase